MDGAAGGGPGLPAPPGMSSSRVRRGGDGPTGTAASGPGAPGRVVSPGKSLPFPGRGALGWAGRGGERRPGSPTGAALSARWAAAFRQEPPHAPSGVPSAAGATWSRSCSCGPTRGRRRASTLLGRGGGFWGAMLGCHPREGEARTPHAAATCAAQPAPSGLAAEGVAARPAPPRAAAGAAALRPGAERGELFPAGAERRPAEAGPFPPAPVGKHLLAGALVGAQPAGPRRQPRSSLSPAPPPNRSAVTRKPSCPPASAATAALPGTPAAVRSQREASLPASPEAAPE